MQTIVHLLKLKQKEKINVIEYLRIIGQKIRNVEKRINNVSFVVKLSLENYMLMQEICVKLNVMNQDQEVLQLQVKEVFGSLFLTVKIRNDLKVNEYLMIMIGHLNLSLKFNSIL